MTDNGGADHFLDTIKVALADPHPLSLLLTASAIVAALDPAHQRNAADTSGEYRESAVALTDFCQTLLLQGEAPSLALAGVIGEIVGEGVLRATIQRELVASNTPAPAWIRQLDQTRVRDVISMTDVLGDGQNIVIEARLPGEYTLSAIVYVDHNIGTVVKSGFFIPESLDQVRAAWRRAEDEQPDLSYGSVTSDLAPADARARLTKAVDEGQRFEEPIVTENWPACEPLLTWLLGLMPEGGSGYSFLEVGESELVALADDFFASQWGKPLDSSGHRVLIDAFLDFSSGTANGDPLRWSAVSVEILLMDWLPRIHARGIPLFDDVPLMLRALIRFSHSERDIFTQLTDETVAAVDAWEPEFRALVAVLAGTGTGLHRNDVDEISEQQYWAYQLEALSDEVGGTDALMALDVAPLPDEAFDWSAIPEDIVPRVSEVLDLVDVAVPALFGGSHRSDGKPTDYSVDELGVACRRFLARVASAKPQLFRRKGAAKTFAAAVVWIVGKANYVVGQYWVQSKVLQAHFNVGTVTQRAEPMLAAVGANRRYDSMGLGDVAVLTAATRQRIIVERDDALARISALSEPDSHR